LKEYLDKIDLSSSETIATKDEGISIVEKIKKQAAEYFTKEQALTLISELRVEIEKFSLTTDLYGIYDLTITFQ